MKKEYKSGRRRILELLSEGPATPQEIAEKLNLSLRHVQSTRTKNKDLIISETLTIYKLAKPYKNELRLSDFRPLVEQMRNEGKKWTEIQKILKKEGLDYSVNTIWMNFNRPWKK